MQGLFSLIESHRLVDLERELKKLKSNQTLRTIRELKNSSGDTLLHAAVGAASKEAIAILSRYNMYINVKNGQGRSALQVAIDHQSFEMIESLVNADIQIEKSDISDAISNNKSIEGSKILALLSSRYRWQEDAVGFRFNRVVNIVRAAIPSLRRAVGLDKLFVIGVTGSGKSTLINYLNGSRYEIKWREESGDDRPSWVSGEPEFAKVGQSYLSETLVPQVIGDACSPFVYCDLAGLFDNRGEEERIVAASTMQMLSRMSGKIKGILVVLDLPSLGIAGRGERFKNVATAVAQMLGGNRALFQSVHYAITHVPFEKFSSITTQGIQEDYIQKLSDALDKTNSEKGGLGADEHDLKYVLEDMLRTDTDQEGKIIIPDITDRGRTRREIRSKLSAMTPHDAGEYDFIRHDGSQMSFNRVLSRLASEYVRTVTEMKTIPARIQDTEFSIDVWSKESQNWQAEVEQMKAQKGQPFDDSKIQEKIDSIDHESAVNHEKIAQLEKALSPLNDEKQKYHQELNKLDTSESILVKEIEEEYPDRPQWKRVVYVSPYSLTGMYRTIWGGAQYHFNLEKPKLTGKFELNELGEKVRTFHFDEDARVGNYQEHFGADGGISQIKIEINTSSRYYNKIRIEELKRLIDEKDNAIQSKSQEISRLQEVQSSLQTAKLDWQEAIIEGQVEKVKAEERLKDDIELRQSWIHAVELKMSEARTAVKGLNEEKAYVEMEYEVNQLLFEDVYDMAQLLDLQGYPFSEFKEKFNAQNPDYKSILNQFQPQKDDSASHCRVEEVDPADDSSIFLTVGSSGSQKAFVPDEIKPLESRAVQTKHGSDDSLVIRSAEDVDWKKFAQVVVDLGVSGSTYDLLVQGVGENVVDHISMDGKTLLHRLMEKANVPGIVSLVLMDAKMDIPNQIDGQTAFGLFLTHENKGLLSDCFAHAGRYGEYFFRKIVKFFPLEKLNEVLSQAQEQDDRLLENLVIYAAAAQKLKLGVHHQSAFHYALATLRHLHFNTKMDVVTFKSEDKDLVLKREPQRYVHLINHALTHLRDDDVAKFQLADFLHQYYLEHNHKEIGRLLIFDETYHKWYLYYQDLSQKNRVMDLNKQYFWSSLNLASSITIESKVHVVGLGVEELRSSMVKQALIHQVLDQNLGTQLLLNSAQEVMQMYPEYSHESDDRGMTPLMALTYQTRQFLPSIIRNPGHLNAQDRQGQTAIHRALPYQIDLARTFVQLGADLNLADNKGRTGLHLACHYLNAKQDAAEETLETEVISELESFVRILVGAGATINIKDHKRRTPLDYLKDLKTSDIFRFLSKEKLRQKESGSTEPRLSIFDEIETEPEAALISNLRLSDIDAVDAQGNSVLIHAVLRNKKQLVSHLLSSGVSTQHHNKGGWTAYHFAALILQDNDILDQLMGRVSEFTTRMDQFAVLNDVIEQVHSYGEKSVLSRLILDTYQLSQSYDENMLAWAVRQHYPSYYLESILEMMKESEVPISQGDYRLLLLYGLKQKDYEMNTLKLAHEEKVFELDTLIRTPAQHLFNHSDIQDLDLPVRVLLDPVNMTIFEENQHHFFDSSYMFFQWLQSQVTETLHIKNQSYDEFASLALKDDNDLFLKAVLDQYKSVSVEIIFDAIQKGAEKCVITILDVLPGLLSKPNESGETPMAFALSLGNADIADIVKSYGADLSLEAEVLAFLRKASAFSQSQRQAMSAFFIQSGVSIDFLLNQKPVLDQAIEFNVSDFVEAILSDAHTDLNGARSDHPLDRAIYIQRQDVIDFLLRWREYPLQEFVDYSLDFSNQALSMSLIATLFKQAYLDPNQAGSLLEKAVELGRHQCIDGFLAAWPVSLDLPLLSESPHQLTTALEKAIMTNSTRVFQHVLEHQSVENWTARTDEAFLLHAAVIVKNAHILDAVLALPGYSTHFSVNGKRAQDIAILRGQKTEVISILSARANQTHLNYGPSIYVALEEQDDEAYDFLVKQGVSVKRFDSIEDETLSPYATPLHHAISMDAQHYVAVMLPYLSQKDLQYVDQSGFTPLGLAVSRSHLEIARMLGVYLMRFDERFAEEDLFSYICATKDLPFLKLWVSESVTDHSIPLPDQALTKAIHFGHFEGVQYLYETFPQVMKQSVFAPGFGGKNGFEQAISEQHDSILDYLFQKALGKDELSLMQKLWYAAALDQVWASKWASGYLSGSELSDHDAHSSMMRLLLNPDPHSRAIAIRSYSFPKQGESAYDYALALIDYAVGLGHYQDAIKLHQRRSSRLSQPARYRMIRRAIEEHQLSFLQELMTDSDNQAVLNAITEMPGDLLWVRSTSQPMFEAIWPFVQDPLQVDAKGKTALHHAAARGDMESVQFLIESGLSLFQADQFTMTAQDYLEPPQLEALEAWMADKWAACPWYGKLIYGVKPDHCYQLPDEDTHPIPSLSSRTFSSHPMDAEPESTHLQFPSVELLTSQALLLLTFASWVNTIIHHQGEAELEGDMPAAKMPLLSHSTCEKYQRHCDQLLQKASRQYRQYREMTDESESNWATWALEDHQKMLNTLKLSCSRDSQEWGELSENLFALQQDLNEALHQKCDRVFGSSEYAKNIMKSSVGCSFAVPTFLTHQTETVMSSASVMSIEKGE